MVTAIANPTSLKEYIKHGTHDVQELSFSDHHQFTSRDIDRIQNKFNSIENQSKIIITTEKDMVRFRDMSSISEQIRQRMYYIPVYISFLNNAGKDFDRKILSYVKENKGNFNFYSSSNWV